MTTSICSQCGQLNEMLAGDPRCNYCGAALATPAARPDEHVAELNQLSKFPETAAPAETPLDVQIRRSDHGETLAVLALILPLVTQGLALAGQFDAYVIALSWSTVVATAVLLAIDAAFLGATDLQGKRRGTPLGLFFGIVIIWILCYPVAFFRRRHFGRPNLGPLAILVALFFVGVPLLQNFSRFGTLGGQLPTCTSREVVGMVDDMIRKSPLGPAVISIGGHRETSHDNVKQVRHGECQIKTQQETITATYRVTMLNRQAGTFQVEVDPIFAQDPPFCTDPEVIALLENLLRQDALDQHLKAVIGHEQTSYDADRKIRHGRCTAIYQTDAKQNNEVTRNFRVYWLDQKTGQFQVELAP